MQEIELIQPTIFAPFSEVIAAQTTRTGGYSKGPYGGLNLGKSTDDDPSVVMGNLTQLKNHLDFSDLALSHQIHGLEILVAEAPGIYQGYDAIVTNKPNLLIGVSVADCCPILIFDAEKKVIAAVHAGWKGTVGKLVSSTIALMQTKFKSNPGNCYVYIGTCISQQHFEVGIEVADQFATEFKQFDPLRGKFLVDLKSANANQCIEALIPASQIEYSPFCTFAASDRFFSHRKSAGITGRMLAVIGLK